MPNEKTDSARIARMRRNVERALTALHSDFVGDVKLTFIARFPGFPEQDVLITSDPSLDELAALLDRSKDRPETVGTSP